MKSELRENMYVRTKDGIIAKVDYIDNDTIFFDKELHRTYGDSIDFLEKDNLERIVKASYSIIDILEEGDYVNGYKVSLKGYDYAHFVQCDYPVENGTTNHYKFYEQAIKSVVTKQQFENMEYKVGE